VLQLTSYNNGTKKIPAVSMIIAPQNRSYDATTYSFGFGYSEASDDGSFAEDNKLPFTTAILHGNYNFAADSTVWDPTIASHALPASLYRTSKPTWWGNLPWPSIGPDSSNPTLVLKGDNPAKVRFENGGIGVRQPIGAASARNVPTLCVLNQTTISYRISIPGDVRLEMFTATGRRVAMLAKGHREAGSHQVAIGEQEYPSGAYCLRLTVGNHSISERYVRF
jgi:hypothetical protein